LYTFNPAQHDDFPTDMEVISSSFANLSISDDGSRIFFGMEKTTTPIDPLQTQIWNADDKFLYPVKVNNDKTLIVNVIKLIILLILLILRFVLIWLTLPLVEV
jgi:hypothetical protein